MIQKFSHRSPVALAACCIAPVLIGGAIAFGMVGDPGALDSIWAVVVGFVPPGPVTDSIGRRDIRFTLTTLAAAQASILAIVFSITFIGVQLVSTNYTLRTLGQLSLGNLFGRGYAMLGFSLLVDILLIVFLPSTANPIYVVFTWGAILLFLVSLVSLGWTVSKTMELTTPAGLASSLRQNTNIPEELRQESDETEPGPTDALYSLTESAIKNEEWATVEEGYEEYQALISELVDEAEANPIGGQAGNRPSGGTLATRLYGRLRSRDEINQHRRDGLFREIFRKQYRHIVTSAAQTGNQEKVDEYLKDLWGFGIRGFEDGLPMLGLSVFRSLKQISAAVEGMPETEIHTERPLEYRLKLLSPAVRHDHITTAIAMQKSLRSDLHGGSESAPTEIDDERSVTIHEDAVVSICRSLIPLIGHDSFGIESQLQLEPVTNEPSEAPTHRDLLIALNNQLRCYLVKWGIEQEAQRDESIELLQESLEYISRVSNMDRSDSYLVPNVQYLTAHWLRVGDTDLDDASTEFLQSCLCRIALGDEREAITNTLSRCNSALDRERTRSGIGAQPGWEGQWVELVQEEEFEDCQDKIGTLQDQFTNAYNKLLFQRVGPMTVFDAFGDAPAEFLDSTPKETTRLDDQIYLCEFAGGDVVVVVLCRDATGASETDASVLRDRIKETTLDRHHQPAYRLLTCNDGDLSTGYDDVMELSLGGCVPETQSPVFEYIYPDENVGTPHTPAGYQRVRLTRKLSAS